MCIDGTWILCHNKNNAKLKGAFINDVQNTRGRGKRFVALATTVACCVFMVGCGLKNPAKAPFSSTDCKKLSLEDAISELQTAGFTEITTEEVETVSLSKNDKVESITIDGEDNYKKDQAWESNVPVEITSYKLKQFPVEMNVETNGESDAPIFVVHTNLPEGATLRFSLVGNDFEKSETVKVQNGTAESNDAFHGSRPLQGEYVFTVTMDMKDQLWNGVSNEVGIEGECLTGELVRKKDDSNAQYVYLEYPYTAVSEENESSHQISENEMTALLENALERGFGSDYQLEKDDSGYTIYIWSDGNAMCATLAKSGNAAQKNAWKNIVSTTVEASKTIQDKLVENGYGDYVSVINILNDVDHDYVLCTASMGALLYDCTE